MKETRNAYRIVIGNPHKITVWRMTHILEGNIRLSSWRYEAD
jgi:hypothetical protein